MVKQMDLGSFFCLLLYRHVRDFYVDVTAMMVKKFPFRDQTLKSLGFVNSRVKDTVLVDSGEFFPTLYLTQTITIINEFWYKFIDISIIIH